MYRRNFLKYCGLSLGALMTMPVLSLPGDSQQKDKILEIAYGKLKGLSINGVDVFKGVPYAGKVSGERRFLTPGKLKPWTGILNAQNLGNPSIQIPNQTFGINEPDPAEDCLFLNIWTPACDHKKRPVMFYSHGGGYLNGSAGSTSQDGTNLARLFDVVVVETNHRLGLLGYLYLDELADGEYTGSGNRGIQDIAIALKWVHENIESFGGNPDNVMIFGESGGGLKTSCLYAMPEAAPYFNKASIESGPGVRMKESNTAAETTELLLKELNISSKSWKKLLTIPAMHLLDAQVRLQKHGKKSLVAGFKGIGAAGLGDFGPVVDGVILPEHPFSPKAPAFSKNKPLLVGWNEDEQIFFSMMANDKDAFHLTPETLEERLSKNFEGHTKDIIALYKGLYPQSNPSELYFKIYSLLSMGLGTMQIANQKATQNGAPVYLYNFGYKSELKVPDTEFEFGSMHAMDIPFKFYNIDDVLDKSGKRSSGWAGNRQDRFQAAKNMCTFWTNFAQDGIPKANGQPNWIPYEEKNKSLMRLDYECKLKSNPYEEEIKLWNQIFI